VFPNFGEGVPLYGGGISGVGQGVSEFLQAVYNKTRGICCRFAAVLKFNFGFPNGGGPSWCQDSDGRQRFPTDRITKPIGVCYSFVE